jgi:cobalamin biosynthesis Mg chelatase CobN
VPADDARTQAGWRVFGSKPGAYGAGLQALFDTGRWESDADLAAAYCEWGGYAYGRESAGVPATARFNERLSALQLVVQGQDNREHDLLDSDDYYQFHGGMAAAVRHLSGSPPPITRTTAIPRHRAFAHFKKKSRVSCAREWSIQSGSRASGVTATKALSRWRRRSTISTLSMPPRMY